MESAPWTVSKSEVLLCFIFQDAALAYDWHELESYVKLKYLMGGSPFWKKLAVAFNRLLPDFVLVSFCKAREIKMSF